MDFLIKIGAIVVTERGSIQVKHGPRTHVEVLPLNMVNMLQKMNSETLMRDVTATLESTHLSGGLDVAIRNPSLYDHIMPQQVDAHVLHSDNDIDDNEHRNEGPQLAKLNGDDYEFGNTELENLVLSQGPQQIVQLIIQKNKLMILWKKKSQTQTTMLIRLSGFLCREKKAGHL